MKKVPGIRRKRRIATFIRWTAEAFTWLVFPLAMGVAIYWALKEFMIDENR